MELILLTLIVFSSLGVVLAIILYFVAQKFKVYEDPKIDEVEAHTPGANCGGCGYPGCRGFAEACVKADSLDGLFCPPGGNEVMANIAKALGQEAVEKEPQVAVLRCNGSPDKRRKTSFYDGPKSCAIASKVFSSDTDCQYGCLALGDCVKACTFDAMKMNSETELPEIDEEKCTACNACVTACPKGIIELRNKGKKGRRIYVSCINKDKGGVAKKACESACIGCKKCEKVCAFDAIKIVDFCAYIDFEKCKLCRKCAPECPTGAILEVNFPPRKLKEKQEETPKKEVKESN
jgi:Na+-translocating ferredoxin:NAD+ oxidoreductase subunit B